MFIEINDDVKMSKANIELTFKVRFKEFLLEKDIDKILQWLNVHFVEIKDGARDLRNVLYNALDELLHSPYTKLPDNKNALFKDILDEYDSKGSFDSFKILESELVGDELVN